MGLTFVCLAIALHGDTLRCANNPGGVEVVQLAAVEASELSSESAAITVPLKQLVPGKVSCRQVDADPRTAGFQNFTVAGKMVARCTAGGQDLSALLLAEQGPQLRDKPRSRGVWARRVDMTRTWLVAGN